MEMTESVYRKIDPGGGSSSLSAVKSVEADEVLNKTSDTTENAGDPNHRHSAGREQQGGIEMTESVYRKVDPDGGSSSLSAVKYVEADEVLNKTSTSTENAADPNHRHSGTWKSVAVCLGLLCTLLLFGIALLSVQIMLTEQLENSYREKLQMQADYDNMSSDYQQLQMIYNDLNSVKAQLQDTNSNLTRANLQLQTRYARLSREKDHIQLNKNAIVKDKDRLQARYNNLIWENSQLEASYKNLTSENPVLQGRYVHLLSENSNLQAMYDNLTTRNIQLETSYKNLTSKNAMLQGRYNNLLIEKYNLQTTNNNLTLEKSKLQDRYDILHKANSHLQISYSNVSAEKDELQDRYNNLTSERYDNVKRVKSQLQDRYDRLTRDQSQLQQTCDAITAERDTLLQRTVTAKKQITQYAVDVTLDPDTAHNKLILSADGKQVKHGDTSQNRHNNPKRFTRVVSVLGKQGFSSGRFYYEVQVSGKTAWSLGVAKESINKEGSITLSPTNGYWTIWLRDSEYKALAEPRVTLSLKEKPERVGVFVDYGAGLVSFYDADRWSLIYSNRGVSFREKIYPYFCPNTNDNGKNSAPLVITPVSCFK